MITKSLINLSSPLEKFLLESVSDSVFSEHSSSSGASLFEFYMNKLIKIKISQEQLFKRFLDDATLILSCTEYIVVSKVMNYQLMMMRELFHKVKIY